jgi:hypothetical protein
MPRWSTTAAEGFIRKALVPLGGLGVFIWEARLEQPQPLIVAASVTLMLGQPVAAMLDGRKPRDSPPGPTTSPAPREPGDDPPP